MFLHELISLQCTVLTNLQLVDHPANQKIQWGEKHQYSKAKINRPPHRAMQEIKRHPNLKRRRPHHVYICHHIHQPLRVHWHQVHNLSRGWLWPWFIAQYESLENKRKFTLFCNFRLWYKRLLLYKWSIALKTSINEWLGNVFKYCASNKLLINFNTKIRRNLALRWQNVIFKYLGTFFDEHLKWYAIERLKRTNCKLSIKWESATIRNKEKFIRYDQQAKKQCSTTPRGRATPQRAAPHVTYCNRWRPQANSREFNFA